MPSKQVILEANGYSIAVVGEDGHVTVRRQANLTDLHDNESIERFAERHGGIDSLEHYLQELKS